MEDKQVYSTAWSAELKRQFDKYQKNFLGWLEKRKSQKKSQVKKTVKKSQTPVLQKLSARQSTVVSHIEPKTTDYETQVKRVPPKISKDPAKYPEKVFISDNVKNLITYTLFGFIVFFILLGIYLTYK